MPHSVTEGSARKSARIRRVPVPHHPPASPNSLSPITGRERRVRRRRLLEEREVAGGFTEEDSEEEEEQVAAVPRTSPRLSGRTPVVCPIQAPGAGDAGAYPHEAESATPVVGDSHQVTQVDEHVQLRHEPSVPPTVLPAVTPTTLGQQVRNISLYQQQRK